MATNLLYKITWVALLYLLFLSQYKLWFTDEGVIHYWDLSHRIEKQQEINKKNIEINQGLYAEVNNLKQGLSAIEERARYDLGLIREGERYYQIIE